MTAALPPGQYNPGPEFTGPSGPTEGQGTGTPAQPGPSAPPAWGPPTATPAAPAQSWGPPAPQHQSWGNPAASQPSWQSQPGQQRQAPPAQPQQQWSSAPGFPPGGQVNALPAPQVPENVARGVLFSLGSLVVGGALAVLFAWGGIVASLSAIAAAYAALWLYVKGAGTGPRKGGIPLLLVLLLGIVVQFLAVVGFGVWRVSRGRGASQWQYVLSSMFNPAVWEGYAMEGIMIVIFSLLGIFGTIRGLISNRR